MIKKSFIYILLFLLIISLVSSFTPQTDIDLRSEYSN